MASLEQGITIGIVGIAVVFGSLIFLSFFLKGFGKLLQFQNNRKQMTKPGFSISKISGEAPLTDEIVTAIALAIHQNRQEFHDMEETIITMNRITRPYSPWSSKIHGIRKPAR